MTSSYDIDGVSVEVSGSPAAADDARSRLRPMQVSMVRRPNVSMEFRSGVAAPAHVGWPRMRPVYDPPAGTVLYSDAHDLLAVQTAHGVSALCRPSHSQARIWAGDGSPAARRLASHAVFTLCLVELLRARQRFNLHAAALSARGAGLLVAGSSGAGKSTLTVALLRAGFAFMSDDTCFLVRRRGGITVVPLPDAIDVTDTTIGFFGELAPLLHDPVPDGSLKRQLHPESIYDVAYGGPCTAGVIVFPDRMRAAESRLEPMAAAEALLELTPNLLLTAPLRAQEHLEILADLVRTSSCYRLLAGTDFTRQAQLLGDLLQQTPAAVSG